MEINPENIEDILNSSTIGQFFHVDRTLYEDNKIIEHYYFMYGFNWKYTVKLSRLKLEYPIMDLDIEDLLGLDAWECSVSYTSRPYDAIFDTDTNEFITISSLYKDWDNVILEYQYNIKPSCSKELINILDTDDRILHIDKEFKPKILNDSDIDTNSIRAMLTSSLTGKLKIIY